MKSSKFEPWHGASYGVALALALATVSTSPLSAASAAQDTAPWQDITPKSGLSGWRTTGGAATYDVVDGELVGRAMVGKTNSWLVSDARFGDYIMEFDAKTDPLLNSGVMVRGQSRPDYRNGVVHGYQAEIDPSPRAWSGGMYDEQRRQWLYSLGRNDAARSTFRSGDWNHYRIEAIGNRLRTWINGVPATDVVDDTDAAGFIAFQVHAIPDRDAARHPEARFRNIRVITDRPQRFAMPETGLEQQGWLANRLGDRERKAGWTLLWDGRTGAGWRSAKGGAFPTKGWSIANGALSVTGGGGDIVTATPYRNFELSVDFRIAEGANSGIKYRIAPDGSGIGLEYQLLDDARHPDAKMGRDGNRTLASLYDLIPASNLLDPASPGKRINPPGEWNRAVIVVRGNHVEHWLNGFKMVAFERGSPAFRAAVSQSKFANVAGFGEWPESPILLQDHGDHVDFRSIKLRKF
ncbi:3-keto-disaccharide hydrolase [Sphingomonas sp. Tas61C01]|uniref:3-keto-disaccharide hydrolase n=1 Tax=Sphingomonas sp. Tas61C01 TaxID=3458297 RepID=UPI00403EACF6